MWIYLPKDRRCSVCSPEQGDLTSPSKSLSDALASSAMWRSKFRLAPSWLRAWKTAPSLKRLSGAMCLHSLPLNSEGASGGSLVDFLAPTSPSPASAKGLKGREAGSGSKCSESPTSPGRNGSSRRMFAASSQPMARRETGRWTTGQMTLLGPSEQFSGPWPTAGGMRNGSVFVRPMLALPTGGSGCSFSQGVKWNTPNANPDIPNSNCNQKDKAGRLGAQAAAMCPTAQNRDFKGHPGAGFTERGGAGANRARDAEAWPTPRTSDQQDPSMVRVANADGPAQLREVALRFLSSPPAPPTPERGRGSSSGGPNSRPLWPTVRANELCGRGTAKRKPGTGGMMLSEEAALWQTISVADTTGGRLSRSGKRSDEPLLRGQAKQWQMPRAEMDSGRHRGEADTLHSQVKNIEPKKRLNPNFVAWLMGWPPGWTDFEPLGTASWLYRVRSLLSHFSGGGE